MHHFQSTEITIRKAEESELYGSFCCLQTIKLYLVETGTNLADTSIIVPELLLDQPTVQIAAAEMVGYELLHHQNAGTTLPSELQGGSSSTCFIFLSIAVSHIQRCKIKRAVHLTGVAPSGTQMNKFTPIL